MNSTRKIGVITGVIFIIATLTGPILATPLTPVLTGTDYLTRGSSHPNQVAGGVLLWIIAAFASAGIAITMYPVLKERNVGLVLGSVIFRALEAVFYLVGVVSLLSVLVTLDQRVGTAVAGDRTSLQAIVNLLVSVHDQAGLVAVFAFCLGAFMYYYLMLAPEDEAPREAGGLALCAIWTGAQAWAARRERRTAPGSPRSSDALDRDELPALVELG